MRKYLLSFFACFCLLATAVRSGAQEIITTVAGLGTEGFGGDGKAPDACLLHWPQAIALDDSGSIYIADAENNVIRKIKNGIITTVAGTGFEAGTGEGGYFGDSGPATDAHLFNPTGVAVDTFGNIYIADQGNNVIRKVDATGIITTFAGTGMVGNTGDGGAAGAAELYAPTRVAVDRIGNVYIADSGNNRIRMVNISGAINAFAGNGTPGFGGDGGTAAMALLNHPVDMVADTLGNVYIADYGNNDIRMVSIATGNISTFAGISIAGFSGDGSAATNANLYLPSGVAIDNMGNVYISDEGNARIRMVNAAGMITTFAGDSSAGYNGDYIPAKMAELYYPEGLAVTPGGNLYIADEGNNRVRYVSATLAAGNIPDTGIGINIYPNPNDGAFTLKIASPMQEQATVTITNITGEKVYETSILTNNQTSITFAPPPGLYFLSAITVHGVVNEKIIIAR